MAVKMIPDMHVTFELLIHAAFVAGEIWGFMLEPALKDCLVDQLSFSPKRRLFSACAANKATRPVQRRISFWQYVSFCGNTYPLRTLRALRNFILPSDNVLSPRTHFIYFAFFVVLDLRCVTIIT